MNRSAKPNRANVVSLDPRFNRLLGVFLIALLLALGLTSARAQEIKLKNARFDPLAGPVVLQGLPSEKLTHAKPAAAVLKAGERRVVILQWADGLSDEKLAAFQAAGGTLISPLPGNAYLALAPAGVDPQLLVKPQVKGPRWAGALAPEWKLDPRVQDHLASIMKTSPTTTTQEQYTIQFAYTGGEKEVRAALKGLGRAGVQSTWKNFETWNVAASPAQVETLAKMNSVIWIEPYFTKVPLGERAGLSIANLTNSTGADVSAPGSYATWLNKVGLSGQGVTVQVMDDGLSQGIDSNIPGTAHPDICGRIAGIFNATTDPLGNSIGGHGHLNASIIMGQPIAGLNGGHMKDPGNYLLGQGVAPGARVYATKMLGGTGTLTATMDALVKMAYDAGSRISSNSWGYAVPFYYGEYVSDSQLFDRLTRDASSANGFQAMTFVFAAGNSGMLGVQSISPPATAKNIISVGAGENSDKGEVDKSYVGPESADDLRDIALFSSRGPLTDGRMGPTLVAPGTHVSGAASDDPKFDGSGVSGRMQIAPDESPSTSKYYPAHQSFYTWSSGTSHACPTVAGAAALLYEYFKKTFGAEPSPALVKAMLIAGAVDTAGGNRNFLSINSNEKLPSIPNNDAGWGRCSLAGIVDNTRNIFKVDQTDLMSFNGQTYTYKIPVADPSKPLKIALAWTDAPASLAATTALVNDLDLTVTNGIDTWRGNVFVNGQSATGGLADHLNNMECVFINKPEPAIYTVTVSAYNLMGDALNPIDPGNRLRQDYALYVSNGNALSSTAQVSFDQDMYHAGQTARIMLDDLDMKAAGSVTVRVSSYLTGDYENVTLTETPAASGFFRGSLQFNTAAQPTANDGSLTIDPNHTDTLLANYADNGGVSRVAKAFYDQKAPVLVSQEFTEIGLTQARLKLATNEPTTVRVDYGEFPSRIRLTQSSTLLDTQHELLLGPLWENSPYFYKITLTDKAGNTVVFDNNGILYTFQTKQRHVDFGDNFESGAVGWTHSSAAGTIDDWMIRTPYPDLPSGHAWVSSDVNYAKDCWLVSPPIKINDKGMMQFSQWYRFQMPSQTYGYDGGVIEISTDNGVSWSDLGPQITMAPVSVYPLTDFMGGFVGNYDALMATGGGNPLGGRMAWTGRSWDKTYGKMASPVRPDLWNTSATTPNYHYMYPVDADLSPYAGQTAMFRFRIGTNNSVAGDKWIVDDFSVFSPLDGVTSLARLKFDAPKFNGGVGRIRFTLIDSGLSAASGARPSSMGFRVASNALPEASTGITVPVQQLKMINPAGIWEGYLTIDPGSSPKSVVVGGIFEINEGDWIKLSYDDPDVGDRSQYTVSDTTTLDWTPPTLLTNDIDLVRNHDFRISLTADEPVTVTVNVGTSMDAIKYTFKRNVFSTAMEVMAVDLSADTPWYYTVMIQDVAGNTSFYDNDGFGFGVRTKSYNPLLDDLETLDSNGAPNNPAFHWNTVTDIQSGTTPHIWGLKEGGINHTATHSWFGQSTPDRSDSSLVLQGIDIQDGFKLSFWHSFQFEAGLDGGVLEISRDGGATWEDLSPQIISGMNYNYVIAWNYGSPIAGRWAWSGNMPGGMQQVVVDLSPYAGANRQIRWRLVCDANGRSISGWFIDDIGLDTYGPSSLDFPGKPTLSAPTDGTKGVSYNQAITLKWGAAPKAANYRVYVGTNPGNLTLVNPGTVSTNWTISEPSLMPGTTYYWRIVAVNGPVAPGQPVQQTASDLRTFKTQIIDPNQFARQLIGYNTLTSKEITGGDYNKDGKLDVRDLLDNLRRR